MLGTAKCHLSTTCLLSLSFFISSFHLFFSFSASTLRYSTRSWMTFHHKFWLCANSRQSSESSQLLVSLDTRSFQRYLCPPAAHLSSTGAHTNSYFSRWLSFIWEMWLRKQSLCWESTEESFCCFAILMMVVCRFFSHMNTPRMILRQRITKPCKWCNWGSWRTKPSRP